MRVVMASLVIGLACGASAGVVTYTNQASFLAAVSGPHYLETFDGVANTFAATSWGPTNGFSYDISNGTFGLYSYADTITPNLATDALTVTFTGNPVTAVAGDFFASANGAAPLSENATVTLNDGTFIVLGPSSTFAGFTSDVAITSLTLTVDNSSSPPYKWATFDNFWVGSAATNGVIPVPAAAVLGLLGTGVVAAFRRRLA